MDVSNLEHLLEQAPAVSRHKLRLLRSFEAGAEPNAPVKDPYYGQASDFDAVVETCLLACSGLLASLRAEYQL
jgi:protein-tyrosine-phosphatase